MLQQTLETERITLVPLADEHLEWEVELDSDPEVMRYLSGRASTREEVEAGHARRMAAARKVDGLGFWIGLTYVRTSPTSSTEALEGVEEGEVEYEMTREQWERRTT